MSQLPNRYSLPKGMHPFEEEFFQNFTPDLENDAVASDYKQQKPIVPTLIDVDFSELDGDDFKTALRKLDSKVVANENLARKINGSRGKRIQTLARIQEIKSSATGQTISAPPGAEVIIEGKSDKQLTPASVGDSLAPVSDLDFKSGLNQFASQKINAGNDLLQIKDFKSGLANYERAKDPVAMQLNQMLGIDQTTHGIIVPNDREIIIEGKNDYIERDHQAKMAARAAAAKAAEQTAQIITPNGGLGTDESLPQFQENGGAQTIIVPEQREVIIEGVSKFILSDQPEDNEIKAMQYYKGKKLNHMTLTFNNDSALDFTVELFNPTLPMQYLIATRLNIDDKVVIAGGNTKYSEAIFYMIGNPTMIHAAQIVVTVPTNPDPTVVQANTNTQLNENFFFKNKNISGYQAIEPLNIALTRDIMQAQQGIVYFNIPKSLNRPFVPDGLDTITYTIKAGNTVNINFFYRQVQFKRMVFEECRNAPNLL